MQKSAKLPTMWTMWVAASLLVVGCDHPTSDKETASGEPQALSASTGAGEGTRGCCPADFELHTCRKSGGQKGLACHNPALGCASSRNCFGGGTGGTGGTAGASGGSGGTGGFICPIANDPLPPPSFAQLGQAVGFAVRAYSPSLGYIFSAPATFYWTAASSQGGAGTFGDPNVSQTTFTCTAVGAVTLTVTIGQVDTTCASSTSWTIVCQP